MKYDDQPVRVFRRFWRCPVCDDGHTEPTGSVLMCNPPQYQHRCRQCGYVFSAEAMTGDIRYEYAEASNDKDDRADQETSHEK